MKIVIALDSFKGALDAKAACAAVARGLQEADPGIECVVRPMADGGEGTVDTLLAARAGGEWIPVDVSGPRLGQRVIAGFGWFGDTQTAIVEMATASGLPLLPAHLRNPLHTTTFGTGELLAAAIAKGARHILLALGGSATNDGGIGAAAALGWRFLDAKCRALAPVGGQLQAIAHIVPPPDPTAIPPITALCDVTHPLCGAQGAAAVFGPQKGASRAMVDTLDAGLDHLAEKIWATLGKNVRDLPGSGAAGGLGAGAVAFLGAELAPGARTILATAQLPQALVGAEWCITGEGFFDTQSLHGKVVSAVAEAARVAGTKCVVFAGQACVDAGDCAVHGIQQVRVLRASGMSTAESVARTSELLHNAARQWLREELKRNDLG
jgi:glycerate kinase